MTPQKVKGAYFPAELLRSAAFYSLKTNTSYIVLCELYLRRVMPKQRHGKKCGRVISNNGDIVLTYTEAGKRWRYSRQRFASAIDDLEQKGFIDVDHGGGLQGDCNKFTISERWKLYGTDDYKPPKPKPYHGIKGFKKDHNHGRNCKKAEDEI